MIAEGFRFGLGMALASLVVAGVVIAALVPILAWFGRREQRKETRDD